MDVSLVYLTTKDLLNSKAQPPTNPFDLINLPGPVGFFCNGGTNANAINSSTHPHIPRLTGNERIVRDEEDDD